MIIGITGGTGCGKTTLLELIHKQGGLVLDCDAIYHQLLKSDPQLLENIQNHFPGTVTNGQLDRKKLGEIVFKDHDALLTLNAIAHGAVKQEVLRQLESRPALAAIDAIGLFEGGLAELCQVTVAVTAPIEQRVERLMKRDNITREYAQTRINAQRPQEEFVRLCQNHLENQGTPEQFREKCLAFLGSLGIMEV